MKSYRLVIRHNGRLVGHFETCGQNALEMLASRVRCLASPEVTSANCRCPILNVGYWKVARRA